MEDGVRGQHILVLSLVEADTLLGYDLVRTLFHCLEDLIAKDRFMNTYHVILTLVMVLRCRRLYQLQPQ